MEYAIVLAVAFVLSTVAAWLLDTAAHNRIAGLEREVEALTDTQELDTKQTSDEIMDLRERLENVETVLASQVTAPGIYNEHGQQVFGGVIAPTSENTLEFGDAVVLDQLITHDLDGTQGNEPEDEPDFVPAFNNLADAPENQ